MARPLGQALQGLSTNERYEEVFLFEGKNKEPLAALVLSYLDRFVF